MGRVAIVCIVRPPLMLTVRNAGEIVFPADRFCPQQLLVLRPGDRVTIRAITKAHVIVLDGAAMDGPRHIWWNFVSSRKERIEQTTARVESATPFDSGDETVFILGPEDRRSSRSPRPIAG
jgi:hypothetical protein